MDGIRGARSRRFWSIFWLRSNVRIRISLLRSGITVGLEMPGIYRGRPLYRRLCRMDIDDQSEWLLCMWHPILRQS